MKKTNRFTLLAFFIAIEVLMAYIPFLGYIPIGVIRATTLHIPVICAGILLGKKEGMIVGFIFGLTSLINNTINPTITSFIFSPFVSIGGISGGWQSLIICFIPRILIGLVSGSVYEILKEKLNNNVAIVVASLLGAITSTILVMGGIYLFYGVEYANALNIAYSAILTFIGGVITTNGIAEAIVGAIICLAICKAGQKVIKL